MKRQFIINISPLKQRRQQLRSSMTKAEKLLWAKLRKKQLGYWFKRQVSISGYIVDFYCPQKRLAIELDGSVHKTSSQRTYDNHRTRYLKQFNITEIRFWNSEVEENIGQVIETISPLLFGSPPLN